MNEILSSLVVASLSVVSEPMGSASFASSPNWCPVGYTVMIPDGREGEVMSKEGDICRIVAAGEAYVTLMPYFIVEPVYPQAFKGRAYSH